MEPASSHRIRSLRTRPMVVWADRFAGWTITLGGILTIAAVVAVAAFLVAVSIPLGIPAEIAVEAPVTIDKPGERPIAGVVDQDLSMALVVDALGGYRAIDLADGRVIEQGRLDLGAELTAYSASQPDHEIVVGLADGTARICKLEFVDSFLADDDPRGAELRTPAAVTTTEGRLVRTREGQLRLTSPSVTLGEPVVCSKRPIIAIDQVDTRLGRVFVTVDDQGNMLRHRQRIKRDLLRNRQVSEVISTEIPPMPEPMSGSAVRSVRLFGQADQMLVLTEKGGAGRYDLAAEGGIRWVGRTSNQRDHSAGILSSQWLQGRGTILVGWTNGELLGGFLGRRDDERTESQPILWAKEIRRAGASPAVALASSARSRLAAVFTESKELSFHQVTTEQELVSARVPLDSTDVVIALSPRDDGAVLVNAEQAVRARLTAPHPNVSWGTLYRPVWYEGYDQPEYVWQSDTSGNAEPKFSLMPLIFGTLKGTLYSMLFGAPLAIFAAIYTSEFLKGSTRARIKPTIELMASLPSVVLGFLGAIVFAPWVSDHLSATLASVVTVPFTFLLAGHLWQLLPPAITIRLEPSRFLFIIAVFPVGLLLAHFVGPSVESVLFAGDFKRWLDGQDGGGWAGWMLILLPASAIAVSYLFTRVLDPRMQPWLEQMDRSTAAVFALVRFLASCAVCVLLAAVVGFCLDMIAWDPRGTVIDSYIQRNSLIVGVIMGFAIIPIIYTIADDALSTVPDHLRSASLGAGATPWQTAMRIVVPTATSGLFSAIMVGLGRAVGETMIVLMAAGSTPIMEWNIFSGFRTLSANIAIELPEAVHGSTHYRILFLAAVVLLTLTSILNTVAELVRLRFRKRAVQL